MRQWSARLTATPTTTGDIPCCQNALPALLHDAAHPVLSQVHGLLNDLLDFISSSLWQCFSSYKTLQVAGAGAAAAHEGGRRRPAVPLRGVQRAALRQRGLRGGGKFCKLIFFPLAICCSMRAAHSSSSATACHPHANGPQRDCMSGCTSEMGTRQRPHDHHMHAPRTAGIGAAW